MSAVLPVPQHIAIIMDGNGRWGKQQGHTRAYGHKQALKSVREVTEECLKLGIPYLSFFAFAQANWARPPMEVDFLMQLFARTIDQELANLAKEHIKVHVVGDLTRVPAYCRKKLVQLMQQDIPTPKLQVVVGLSYSGRWDIMQATRAIAQEVQQGKLSVTNIDESLVNAYLSTAMVPDPDLLIRTSGELRISNFFLWQLANTELYVTPTHWPAFRKEHLHAAIAAYQQRERRFGKTSEQINSQ